MTQRVLFFASPRFDRTEIAFWRALDRGLNRHRLSLVLASATPAPADLGIEHISVTTSLDAFWPVTDGTMAAVPLQRLGLNEQLLLARESGCRGPALVPAIEAHRLATMNLMAAEQLAVLQTVAPVLTVAGSGLQVHEQILAAASRLGGVSVAFATAAPIGEALFVDSQGLATASAVASNRPWPMPSAEWRTTAESLCEQMAHAASVWWESPRPLGGLPEALRSALGIPDTARVALFTGQVDEDPTCFLFAPRHRSNLEAFDWLLQAIGRHPDVFVLGRQHPNSRTPAARFAERLAKSGVRGAWLDDLSLTDALAVADCVAAVNSATLYSALASGKPALAMGEWLLTGQGAAYDATFEGGPVISDWLAGRGFADKRERFYNAMGHLLSRSIYTFDTSGPRAGLLDADRLADRLAESAAGSAWRAPDSLTREWLRLRSASLPNWPANDPTWTDRRDALTERMQDWHRGQALREALLPAFDAARQRRRLRVWGSATAQAAICGLLEAAGAPVDLNTSSSEFMLRTPIPDFIVVATSAHDATTLQLDSLGFKQGVDYSIVEPHLLHALSVQHQHVGVA